MHSSRIKYTLNAKIHALNYTQNEKALIHIINNNVYIKPTYITNSAKKASIPARSAESLRSTETASRRAEENFWMLGLGVDWYGEQNVGRCPRISTSHPFQYQK